MEVKSPLLIKSRSPKNAITIPEILTGDKNSFRKINPSIAIKTGVIPIIQPVFAALVYCNPVTCIPKCNTPMRASNKIPLWLLMFIEKLFPVFNAIIVSRRIPKTRRKKIIVNGISSFNATFVAMNETPQNITAAIGFQYLINFDFNY